MSIRLTLLAATRMTTSPGPAFGRGRRLRSKTSDPPKDVMHIASIVSATTILLSFSLLLAHRHISTVKSF
jgi:hypothetical protein